MNPGKDPAFDRANRHYPGDILRLPQDLRELWCEIVGHKPRDRRPIWVGQRWNGKICGRCGQYPVRTGRCKEFK